MLIMNKYNDIESHLVVTTLVCVEIARTEAPEWLSWLGNLTSGFGLCCDLMVLGLSPMCVRVCAQ